MNENAVYLFEKINTCWYSSSFESRIVYKRISLPQGFEPDNEIALKVISKEKPDLGFTSLSRCESFFIRRCMYPQTDSFETARFA